MSYCPLCGQWVEDEMSEQIKCLHCGEEIHPVPDSMRQIMMTPEDHAAGKCRKKSELDKQWEDMSPSDQAVASLTGEWLSSRILEKAREREYNPSALEWSYDDNLRAIDIDDLKAIIEELTE